MTYDGFDSGADPDSDPAVFYGIPADHPAFRQPEDDDDGEGEYGEPVQYPRRNNEAGSNVIDFPVGRYDGFVGQDQQEMGGPVGVDESRQRAADAAFLRDRLDRNREAIATRAIGQRNAIAHSRSVGEGEGGSGEDKPSPLYNALAASLEQAGVKFRDERIGNGSGDRTAVTVDPVEAVEAFINSSDDVKRQGGFRLADTPAQPLTRATRGITAPPKFKEARMTGMMGGLKSNVAGTWVLTLHIDADSFEEVTKLSMAHGLALDVLITRKVRSE